MIDKTQNRTKRYTIRFTEKEDIAFKNKLAAAGYKSFAKYIRDCALGNGITVPRKIRLTDRGLRDQLNAINASIQKIGVNYNQTVAAINTLIVSTRENGAAPGVVHGLEKRLDKLYKETVKIPELMDVAIEVIKRAEAKVNNED